MSFSSEVKDELVAHMSKARHCKVAELAAILALSADLSELPDRILLQSESTHLVDKADRILAEAYGIHGAVTVRRGQRGSGLRQNMLMIDDPSQVKRLLRDVGFTMEKVEHSGWFVEQGSWHFDKVLEKSCCQQAFIRGAFLAGGSINDPEKNYHIEILADQEAILEDLRENLRIYDIESRIIERARNSGRIQYVLYLKDGEQIVDLLSVMKAHNSLMELENVRIIKDVRNKINRQVNCETANLTKTVNTAVKQVADIRYLMEKGAMSMLTPELSQMAMVRLEHDSAPLKDLGQYLDPPVSKSGVNHRLHRLSEIADELRNREMGH